MRSAWNLARNPLKPVFPPPADAVIARAQKPFPIANIAKGIGLQPDEVDLYGQTKAKISLATLKRLQDTPNGKYVLVTASSPTPLGEGKTTATGLGALNKNVIACIRQPSQGPTFGAKGGAAGGGYSQVIPMSELNMHLTGDMHAIGAATNLCAAALDTRVFHEAKQQDKNLYDRLVPADKKGKREFTPSQLMRLAKLGITETDPNKLSPSEVNAFARLDVDPATITWKRVLDVNDRWLRQVALGQAPTEKGFERMSGFDITVASEVMAVLALASDIKDFRERIGRMVVATSRSGVPVTTEDLCVAGAMTALMVDAIRPTLMQTLEGQPVLVHAGPFANIAHGNSSIIADRIALKLVGPDGYVITEAGFGADMGAEKFVNIKCRYSGLQPDVVVLVSTGRALKYNGGGAEVNPGQRLPAEYTSDTDESLAMLKKGLPNLTAQIRNSKLSGAPVVVAYGGFEPSAREVEVMRAACEEAGAFGSVPSAHFMRGGEAANVLSELVMKAADSPRTKPFEFLYPLEAKIEDKINKIVREVYGGNGASLSEKAAAQLKRLEEQGYGNLPVCMSKTQYSLSHDKDQRGAPKDFTVPISQIRLNAGAGFITAVAGEMPSIPGLTTRPAYFNIDVTESGEITGLS